MNFRSNKRFALLLAAALLLSLAACSKAPTAEAPTDTQTQGSVAADVDFEVFEDNDMKDPENTEDLQPDGAKVDFAEVEAKKGRQNGIDVSKWQGKIDWPKVKAAGIDFAIIRIGYRGEDGQLYRDSNADYHIQQAQKAGILVGVYFFSTAVSQEEAEQEAQWTVSAIKGYPISYPVVYDCEGFRSTDSRMYPLTAAQRTENAIKFLETVEDFGYEGAFYGSLSDLLDDTAFHTAEIEKAYKIWVAQYKSPTYPIRQTPDYSGKFHMWQYTNQGTVPGVEGNCDMVVSYFEGKLQSPKDDRVEIVPAKPPKTQNELQYTDVEETVTAKDEVNLRTGAGKSFSVVTLLKNGTNLKRTGIGKNGWSRLEYNGQTVYAISSYLTTDLAYKPPVDDGIKTQFQEVNEQVTAKSETNLRTLPSATDSQVVYTLKNGEYVTRTGVSTNGWSRLEYNGQTVYAVSSYLTTDLAYKPPVDDGIKTQFQEVNEQVTAKSETNLRTLPSATDSQVVYTLKNGEYVTRTGVSTNGWSRLEYNGQTVYAISSYLTN